MIKCGGGMFAAKTEFGAGLLVHLLFVQATSQIIEVTPFDWSESWYPIITEWSEVTWE